MVFGVLVGFLVQIILGNPKNVICLAMYLNICFFLVSILWYYGSIVSILGIIYRVDAKKLLFLSHITVLIQYIFQYFKCM